MMASFSVLHRSHVFFPAFLGLVRFTMSHVILYCFPSSFRDQIFLESSDDSLSFSFENVDLWLVNRFLNVPSVSPIYVFVSFPDVTWAL